jgi:hypothetical protein
LSYGRRQGGSYEGRRGHGKGFKRYPVELGKEYAVMREDVAMVKVLSVARLRWGKNMKLK